MTQAMQSKTVIGLVVILGVAVGLSLCGKLSAEMVEVLKYVGTAFMSVRLAANVAENLPGNTKE